MKTGFLPRYGVGLLLVVALLFHVLTSSPDHAWGDDFAQYILHARNLVTGIPYAATGYLPNPVDTSQLDVGPGFYPPLLPVLVAPLYKISGVSFRAFKHEQAAFLVLAAAAAWLYFQRVRKLSNGSGIILVGAVAFHPWFWQAKEYIGSDLLFVALVFFSLYLLERVIATENRAVALRLGVILGLSLYLTVATRTVGVVVLATAAVVALPRWRKSWHVLVGLALGAGLWFLQSRFMPDDPVYTQFLLRNAGPSRSIHNLIDYIKEFSGAWSNGFNLTIARLLLAASVPVTVFGMWRKLRERITAVDIFVILYLGAITVWPSFQGVRFLLLLVPVYFYYLLAGAEQLHQRLPLALAALLAVSYGANYAGRNYSNPQDGVTQPDFIALSRVIQETTGERDVFLFRKPRALALMANRPAVIYNSTPDDDLEWKLIGDLKVRYVVVADLPNEDFSTDRTILKPFLERFPEKFEELYSNSRFKLFRVIE